MDPRTVGFLLAGESLAYLLAAIAWVRVWIEPELELVGTAAFCTALCFVLKIVRIAIALIAI